MADFTPTIQTIQSVNKAAGLLNAVRSVYGQAKAVQELMALYQAGTDTAFNAAVNAMFNSAQRTELADMLTDTNALVSNWETDHRSALGLP
jgi:hypothetical protein